jgi:hypothetical protein
VSNDRRRTCLQAGLVPGFLAVIGLGSASSSIGGEYDASSIITSGKGSKEVNCFLGIISHDIDLIVPTNIWVGQKLIVVEANGSHEYETVVNRIIVDEEKHLCRINPIRPGGDFCQPIIIQPCRATQP